MTPTQRGERAKQLLEDEVLIAAFDGVRERIVSQMEASAFGDTETHHQSAITLQLLKQLRLTLRKFVDESEAEAVRARGVAFERSMRQSISKP